MKKLCRYDLGWEVEGLVVDIRLTTLLYLFMMLTFFVMAFFSLYPIRALVHSYTFLP
jgi:hypothetical protein